MLKMCHANPTPFKQPFLELRIGGDVAKKILPHCPAFFIDVDGQIEKYISKENTPTKRLVNLCKSLAKAGIMVTGFQRYSGSAGPNVIMRNGALFQRMGTVEHPNVEVWAFEYRKPLYVGLSKEQEASLLKTT